MFHSVMNIFHNGIFIVGLSFEEFCVFFLSSLSDWNLSVLIDCLFSDYTLFKIDLKSVGMGFFTIKNALWESFQKSFFKIKGSNFGDLRRLLVRKVLIAKYSF